MWEKEKGTNHSFYFDKFSEQRACISNQKNSLNSYGIPLFAIGFCPGHCITISSGVPSKRAVTNDQERSLVKWSSCTELGDLPALASHDIQFVEENLAEDENLNKSEIASEPARLVRR